MQWRESSKTQTRYNIAMEYNNYYTAQSGHPPPLQVTNQQQQQHGGPQMQQLTQQQQQPSPQGGQMIHSPMPQQNIRQTMPSGHPGHHQMQQMLQSQQQQQHLGHHSQHLPSQQQLPNYHQIPHPPHSGSPYPQQQQQQQQPAIANQQQHHMHPQSPHHLPGPPMHVHVVETPMHVQEDPQQPSAQDQQQSQIQLQQLQQLFECDQQQQHIHTGPYQQNPALLLKTFVVEKQPPQVMKTHTRFASSVRLMSSNALNISMINPIVRVTILSESNARAIIQRHQDMIQSSWAFDASTGLLEEKILNINEFESSGEILNNSSVLENEESTGQLVCHFRNMQLKKIKRTEKKGTESVMDEKFVLLFHCVFRICAPYDPCSGQPDAKLAAGSNFNQSQDLVYHIMAFSLPVVVIVHGNQEPHAWATITWHNAFAVPDELLYQVPDKVPWRRLGQVLSDKFKACAGRGLSKHNLNYLANKVARTRVESDEVLVTWNQFAKETLPEKSFTFWEWFHSILKLTREHLRNLWNAERIYGFVDKAGCLELLQGDAFAESKPVGTFLLRYSETELGGITIAWFGPPQRSTGSGSRQSVLDRNSSPINTNLPRAVQHLQPFTSKDLNTRSLADRIRDLCHLVYLYPNIPKNEAFCDYYTRLDQKSAQSNGYVKSMLINTIVTNYPNSSVENNAQNHGDFSVSPTSFDSISQCSPDGFYQNNSHDST